MLKPIIVVTAMLAGSVAMADDCKLPKTPDLPDGATATKAQMLEGQKAIKAYQSGMFDYRSCLEKVIEQAKADAAVADEASLAKAQEAYNSASTRFNEAIGLEQEVAGRFNTEIRKYKAAMSK